MPPLSTSDATRPPTSPARPGRANSVNNRICVADNADNAFSDATIASTNSAPDNSITGTVHNASNDAEHAGPAARSDHRPDPPDEKQASGAEPPLTSPCSGISHLPQR